MRDARRAVRRSQIPLAIIQSSAAIVGAAVDAASAWCPCVTDRTHRSRVGCTRSHPERRPRMRVAVVPTRVDQRRAPPIGSCNFVQSGLCGAEKRLLGEKKCRRCSPAFRRVPGCLPAGGADGDDASMFPAWNTKPLKKRCFDSMEQTPAHGVRIRADMRRRVLQVRRDANRVRARADFPVQGVDS